jgi:hypothetical protein
MSSEPDDLESGYPRAPEASAEAAPEHEALPEALLLAYSSVCDSYHKIDDFRAKLLALLPLASGAGILILLTRDVVAPGRANDVHLIAAGLFGLGATIGLFVYEIRGIQRCRDLIWAGQRLERQLRLPLVKKRRLGAFSAPREAYLGGFVGPLGAALIVYLTVLAGWAYVTVVGLWGLATR